jgi:hypothetical protein
MAKESVETKTHDTATGSQAAKPAAVADIVKRSSFKLVDSGKTDLAISGADTFATRSDAGATVDHKLKRRLTEKLKVNEAITAVTEADLYLHRLQVWAEALESATGSDEKALEESIKDRRNALDKALADNLAAIFAKQRPLEKTYRELDLFYQQARHSASDNDLPVLIANVSLDRLLSDDAAFQSLADSDDLPKTTATSLKQSVAMIVVPGWAGSVADLMKLGQLGQQSLSLVISDFDDCDFERLVSEHAAAGGVIGQLKGDQDWRQQVVLIGNSFRVRQPNRFERDADELRLSPAILFAARVFHQDDDGKVAVPVANEPLLLKSLDGSPVELRWDLRDRKKILELFKDAVIPIARQDSDIVFWGVETLSNETYGKQYNVVRVKEYINKNISDWLIGKTYKSLNEEPVRNAFRDRINRFLIKNMGEGPFKMLAGGECTAVNEVPGAPDQVDIVIKLTFKFAIRNMNLDWVYNERHTRRDG